jgi:hypothetical protein
MVGISGGGAGANGGGTKVSPVSRWSRDAERHERRADAVVRV